jgi:hypothetical protein
MHVFKDPAVVIGKLLNLLPLLTRCLNCFLHPADLITRALRQPCDCLALFVASPTIRELTRARRCSRIGQRRQAVLCGLALF